MKERLKMIFDRIDIFVVCIILGTCVCIAEAFLGFWNIFADCFIMTFLISEVCYTNRCNEKLEIELIEAKEKLKEKLRKSRILQSIRSSRRVGLSASTSYWKCCGWKDGNANTPRSITANAR